MVSVISLSLIVLGTFIGACATFIIKKATDKYQLKKLLLSSSLWGGLFIYVLSVLLYIYVLRTEELSVVYPLVATSYIWTTFFSVRFLGEKMDNWKWAALIGIILGIVFIGLGS
ncbi:MAG: EamA family transporter [Nanoarchaeota archaeon]|nr:EamA family transporter [Nanoarchaeota archaeon]MBU1644240.1 EamA family transporter [Nanoarchaeota archaeon]MBU1977240.1 EamA family transporter [Nanoarchaeota archaeon]